MRVISSCAYSSLGEALGRKVGSRDVPKSGALGYHHKHWTGFELSVGVHPVLVQADWPG